MSPEIVLRLRREPYSERDFSRALIPTKKEMSVFEKSGAFDALDGLIQKLNVPSSDIVPVDPYYKADGQTISMGVRWGFRDDVADNSPIRSCNSLEIMARLDNDEIAIYNGKKLATKISRQQWLKNKGSLASEIQNIMESPQRVVWKETGERD